MSMTMSADRLKKARERLDLTLEQMAELLGYEGEQARSQVNHMEQGKRSIRPAQIRLVNAYLEGYRPKDWEKITGRPK